MLRLIALPLALVAAPALADCPDAGDLDRGITARMKSQPELVLFIREDGVLQRRLVVSSPSDPWRMLFAHPLMMAEVGHPRAATRFDYAEDTDALDRLDTSGIWKSALTLTVPSANAPGDTEMHGEVEARFLGMEEAVVGGCRYRGWQVAVTIRLGDLPAITGQHLYAPDLGLVTRIQEECSVMSLFPPVELATFETR